MGINISSYYILVSIFARTLRSRGFKFFKVYQNLVTMSPFFLSFLPSLLLSCKITLMDDYDGIYNCNSLKYSPFENFDNF